MQKNTLTKTTTGARNVPVTSATPVNTAQVATAKAAPANSAPSKDQIARRAHEIYVARGQTPGHELEDWIQAERELMSKTHRNN
jgi:Protein of unknown function (DUF2934)